MSNSEEVGDIIEIMTNNDPRYLRHNSAEIISFFIKNNAIKVFQEEFPILFKLNKEEINKINGPQKEIKFVAATHLRSQGYSFIGFEVRYLGSIVDLVMKKDNETLMVECGPCRIDKAIDYLSLDNTTLLIFNLIFLQNSFNVYYFTRGPNWDKVYENYLDDKHKKLSSIKNVLDLI